jgi:dipeptidyl aminopeptidase/acylaminoacyl peptidase
MQDRRIIIAAAVVILLLILGGLYLALTPEVVSFTPEDGAASLHKITAIEITFSRAMDQESVMERLSITPEIAGEFTWEENTLRFTPVEFWPSDAEVAVSLAEGAKSKLGLGMSGGLVFSFTVEPILLAYLWPAEGEADIYALDPDGGNILQLTDAGGVLDYEVGPDGVLIYYSADNNLGGSDIFLLDRYQGTATRLLSCERGLCTDIALSPDGKLLAYQRNDSEIWLLDLDSRDEELVSTKGHSTRLPIWSPDGRLTYYDAEEMAYIVLDVESGEEEKLENLTGELGDWSPFGRIFVAPEMFVNVTSILRGPTGEVSNQPVDPEELDPVRVLSSHLMSYAWETGIVTRLTADDQTEDAGPSFSPDGIWLAFTRRYLDPSRWTPGRQVWLISLDGVNIRELTNDPSYKYTALTWHPDGTLIAAVRFNTTVLTEPPELWLIGLDGDALQLVIGGYAPQWIP